MVSFYHAYQPFLFSSKLLKFLSNSGKKYAFFKQWTTTLQ